MGTKVSKFKGLLRKLLEVLGVLHEAGLIDKKGAPELGDGGLQGPRA